MGDDFPRVPNDLVERAVDALDDRFYVLDGGGRVLHANERAAAAAGRSAEELVAAHVTECFPAEHATAVESALTTAREEGVGDATFELDGRSGQPAVCEFRAWRLADGDTPLEFVGVVRDVSKRTRRERLMAELHRSSRELMTAESSDAAAEIAVQTLSELLSLNHAGIHLVDERGESLRPVAWTDRIEDALGEPPELGPGSLAWRAFTSGEMAWYDDLASVAAMEEGETSFGSELIVPLGDHGVALVASTERAAFDADDRRLAQVLCANLTAALDRVVHAERLRRQERKLKRENERLDEFASVVSHDLRNPLNVASGRLELLREECDSEHVEPVGRALDRMETLIEDVLTLAREGQRVDDIEAVDLTSVVEEARTNAAADADATVRVVEGATVYADESRLIQAFENLLRNAVEHGSTDGDPVTVAVGTLPGGFYLEDDGPGIPPGDRERILEAGYSTTADGTGFGLSIVRDIVEAHGWDLTVTEGTDGGARFEVSGVRFG